MGKKKLSPSFFVVVVDQNQPNLLLYEGYGYVQFYFYPIGKHFYLLYAK